MLKPFGSELTLARNSRGCYILDTVKGCSAVGSRHGGCYGECYAASIAKRYRLDFGHPSTRGFRDSAHRESILRQIQKPEVPFVRIGEMGDPSENWEHTLSVVSAIKEAGKPIVITTKHWKPIPDSLLQLLSGVTVNTSTSALDSGGEREYRLSQYERLKQHCNSVLRVVSCRFNPDSPEGARRSRIQDSLFSLGAIDTVFRPSPGNPFLRRGVIFAEPRWFLGTLMLASVWDPGAHFDRCEECPDQCGINPPSPKSIQSPRPLSRPTRIVPSIDLF